MNQKELLKRLKGLDEDTQKQVACALIGHSRIRKTCFGYIYCGRCGAQVGDALGSIYDGGNDVFIGHNCPKCHKNYDALSWEHKFMVSDPFEEAQDGPETGIS